MSPGRMERAKFNAIWGIIVKFGSLFLSFLLRTVMIQTLGAEYLGLNSLFTSVLKILSLAELGFGTAVTFCMYKPIAEHDSEMICALLNLYRKIYFLIGIVIFAIGMAIMPFIRYLIAGTVEADVNIYILYFINLLNVVLSYICFGYSSSLLIAHQRSDVFLIITLFVEFIKTSIQIIILLTVKNYYYYVLMLPAASVITNLLTAYAAKRSYPEYSCHGHLSKETRRQIFQKTTALLSVKITTVIYNAVDSVVISGFMGLIVLAKYNNYYYIMSAIITVISTVYNSITASVGNSIVTESDEKNYRDYMNLTFINAWLIGWCTVCLFCLYQPFMKLWVGEDLMFDFGVVICFCAYFYVFQLKNVQSTYKDAAGLWREDMWRSYASNLFNLIANIVLVQFIGVYGILISTILSLLLISYPWQTMIIHRKLFHCSMRPFVLRLFIYTAATAAGCIITGFICMAVTADGLPGLFIRCVICLIVPNLIFLLLSFRTKEFSTMFATVSKLISGRRA